MQLLKSLFLFGLLALESIAEPILIPRSDASRIVVREEPKAAPLLEAREDPPQRRTNVDLGEARSEHAGETLFTNGLLTCIAVVVRSRSAQGSGTYDKILAHVASTVCSDGDTPTLDDQLDNLFELDRQRGIPDKQVFVLVAPETADTPGQGVFNDLVITRCIDNWGMGNVIWMYRDQSRVNEEGGSRLWIDGTRSVFWSVDGDNIIPS